MKIANILTGINKFSIKTIYVNFKYLPLKKAIMLPIWVNKKCQLLKSSGSIEINGKVIPGMIQIGYGNVGIFDRKRSRSILQTNGKITFNGKTFIGHGCKLSVGKSAILEFGQNVSISAETEIICHKRIIIGNDCLLSWDILIMDTDQHSIKDFNGNIINSPKDIIIEDKVMDRM